MSTNSKIYEVITSKVISQIEEAIKTGEHFTWTKSWKGMPLGNFISYQGKNFKEYRGINRLLLDNGLYITYNQLQEYASNHPEKSFKVKKGSKKHTVYFYKISEYKDKDENGEEIVKVYPLMRFYGVFNIKDIEGLDDYNPVPEYHYDETELSLKADKLIKEFCEKDGLTLNIVKGSDRCFYRPSTHEVCVPEKSAFTSLEEYYAAVFHELVHATSKYLKRDIAGHCFGSKDYSFEELVAELGSCFLMQSLGFETTNTFKNSTAYLQGWLSAIKENDVSFIVKASNQAQKAADYFFGVSFEKSDDEAA